MKKLLMIIPLVILLCFTFGCQQGEEVTEEAGVKVGALTDEDVAAIKASTEAYVQAMRSKDWAALAALYTEVAALYTEDAVWMPPNQPIIRGRAAIQAWNEAYPPVTEFNLTIEEIDGFGNLAYVRGASSTTMEPEGAPEPIRSTGKYIEIRRKQQDGSWLISIDIFNSALPLPPPSEKE
jgi:ketosteroid isomerase-like protein